MLTLSGFAIYRSQTHSYKIEQEKRICQVAAYLERILATDGHDFLWYQNYFLAHKDTLLIPYAFSAPDIQTSRQKFEVLFAKNYPGEIIGETISFDSLSDEVKEAYTIYKHEYYLDRFEQAKLHFGLVNVEYIIPNREKLEVTYTLDSVRQERIVDGKKYIELGITEPHSLEEHKKEWEVWQAGLNVSGYDFFDNESGKNYAFYSPLYIGSRKLGLIGVETSVDKANTEIFRNAIRQLAGIAVILVLCIANMLMLLYRRYIAKLEHLQNNVRYYTQEKNAAIAFEIERDASGKDEISVLAMQVSSMIMELENYMKNLVSTAQQLRDSQQQTAVMSELATKDALTGIRNKTAYDKEVARLEWQIAEGSARFGIAMVDLNFLKRINDTYGHEQGNIAIKKLCSIVCNVFEHSPVFRIGGDEFVVILEKNDYDQVEFLISVFEGEIQRYASDEHAEVWERVSAAIGYAIFNPLIDAGVSNVFRRADKAMYARKKEMKAVREN
ncbi:MAG: GGDEF domain-containing protein [Treponema sp.]|nr:GGDEF domain-containing protein [Treponema sp.]